MRARMSRAVRFRQEVITEAASTPCEESSFQLRLQTRTKKNYFYLTSSECLTFGQSVTIAICSNWLTTEDSHHIMLVGEMTCSLCDHAGLSNHLCSELIIQRLWPYDYIIFV